LEHPIVYQILGLHRTIFPNNADPMFLLNTNNKEITKPTMLGIPSYNNNTENKRHSITTKPNTETRVVGYE
jgi:hypothetical protein